MKRNPDPRYRDYRHTSKAKPTITNLRRKAPGFSRGEEVNKIVKSKILELMPTIL